MGIAAALQTRKEVLAPGAPVLPQSGAGGVCPNCGKGPIARYCAECGQRQLMPHDLTVRGFAHDTFHEFTSIDGRLWNTLVTLVRHPGLLARDYFDGRGGRYMKPLNLFVLLNLVFFLVQPHTGLMQYHLESYLAQPVRGPARIEAVNEKRLDRAIESESQRRNFGQKPRTPVVETTAEFTAHFEDTLQDLKKSMLIVGIPVFAIALGLVYSLQHRRAAEHLVFSSHAWAFFLVFMIFVAPFFSVVMPIARFLHVPLEVRRLMVREEGLILTMLLGIGTHFYFALRRMYGSSRFGAAWRSLALFVALEAFIFTFSARLFNATLWSL